MAPGAIYFHFSVNKDEVQLIDEVIEQLYETKQTSQDFFDEQRLCQESLILTPPTQKNDRDCNSEDLEATPCNKKLKMGENHIKNGDNLVEEEEENVNKTCKNNDETIHQNVSPVSKTEGSSQKMQTVAGYSSTTTDISHAGAPLITSRCSFRLIRTKGDNNGICIIILNQLFLFSLVFKENSDQKVSIHRVPRNDTVISVEVRCPCLYIDVGVGDICYLYKDDLLIIRSIQNTFEYRVVQVDNYKERSSTTTNDDSALDALSLICANQQQGDNKNKNTDLNDLESLLAQEEEAEEGGLFENEQYGKRLAKEAREAKENHLAEMELLVEESLEAVITNTTNNNNTIAPLAAKLVTPEKDRKKKGTINRMSDPSKEQRKKKVSLNQKLRRPDCVVDEDIYQI